MGDRGKYAGQPISFKCPKCRSRGWVSYELTGKTRKRLSQGMNHHGWGDTSYQYRCGCGHVGWSRHPDVARRARSTD